MVARSIVPGTMLPFIATFNTNGHELHDAHGVAGAFGFGGDAQGEGVLAGFQFRSQQDGARIMQAAAVAMKQVHLLKCAAINAGFGDARIRPGDDIGSDGRSLKGQGRLRACFGRAQHRDRGETVALGAGQLFPIRHGERPAVLHRGFFRIDEASGAVAERIEWHRPGRRGGWWRRFAPGAIEQFINHLRGDGVAEGCRMNSAVFLPGQLPGGDFFRDFLGEIDGGDLVPGCDGFMRLDGQGSFA